MRVSLDFISPQQVTFPLGLCRGLCRGDGGRQRVVADGERLSLAQQGGALERDLLHGAGYRSGRLLMRERTPVSLPSHAAAGWVLL